MIEFRQSIYLRMCIFLCGIGLCWSAWFAAEDNACVALFIGEHDEVNKDGANRKEIIDVSPYLGFEIPVTMKKRQNFQKWSKSPAKEEGVSR